MAHYTICAIFPADSDETASKMKNLCETNKDGLMDALGKKLEKPLSKFDRDFEVKPYRVDMPSNEIDDMIERYNETDLNILAGKMDDWNGGKGGVDGKILYYYTTENKNGKFDGWGVYDVMPAKELLSNLDEMERVPQAILLPDCTLVESETWFYVVSEKNVDDFNEWVDKVRNILSEYPNALAVLIDCHA